MGQEHPPETVFRAQELYCVDRLTFDQVAEQLDVAASTLKRWSAQFDWQGKREEIAQAQADIRGNMVLARSNMLQALIDTKDPQTAFAVASLENFALKQAEAARAGKVLEAQLSSEQLGQREIQTPEDVVAALREAVELKLGRMLVDPGQIDFGAIRDLKQALGLIKEMEAEAGKGKGDEGKAKNVSRETTRNIERLLGYKE